MKAMSFILMASLCLMKKATIKFNVATAVHWRYSGCRICPEILERAEWRIMNRIKPLDTGSPFENYIITTEALTPHDLALGYDHLKQVEQIKKFNFRDM